MLVFFFFNDTATTEIYTLSLHDALPISDPRAGDGAQPGAEGDPRGLRGHRRGDRRAVDPAGLRVEARRVLRAPARKDRKSTRLNSSHGYISYAALCLNKKK